MSILVYEYINTNYFLLCTPLPELTAQEKNSLMARLIHLHTYKYTNITVQVLHIFTVFFS